MKQGHQSPACVTCTGTPEKKEFDVKKGWHHELGAGKVAFALKEDSAVRKEPAPLENKHPWKSHGLWRFSHKQGHWNMSWGRDVLNRGWQAGSLWNELSVS